MSKYTIPRYQLEEDFYNIFGRTDGFGQPYTAQDIESWIVEAVADEKAVGNQLEVI